MTSDAELLVWHINCANLENTKSLRDMFLSKHVVDLLNIFVNVLLDICPLPEGLHALRIPLDNIITNDIPQSSSQYPLMCDRID